jgi:hypothetical protein
LDDQVLSIRLRNSRKSSVDLYLEPWGEAYKLGAERQAQVDAKGPLGIAPNNMLEIESGEDYITGVGVGEQSVSRNCERSAA